jgi:membrane protease YdiL (CAAX protease family)
MKSQHAYQGERHSRAGKQKDVTMRLPFLLAAVLVLYNSLINLLPQGFHDQIYIPVNLAVTALVVFLVRRTGFSWASLGLVLKRPWRTLWWGLGVGIVLPSPLFLMLAMPESMAFLIKPWAKATEGGLTLAYQALVRIPLGTVLTEEVLFRGVLYGTWSTVGRVKLAVIGSSVAFGLWHIVPMLELLQRIGQFDPLPLAGGVAGGVISAFLGGLLFCRLRIRGGSAYASILAHWLISALYLLAVFLARS